jgi:(p)ppGpp synthase/HD superfamily hydrolase
MIQFISPEDGHRLDKAITFLVSHYSQTGFNPKPVIFHSLQVAFYLLDYGYSVELAEAAILHDLIEDSHTTKGEIASAFGRDIADRVDALSFKMSIADKERRYKEMFDRIKQAGREALIIKCADIYSNSFYIKLVADKKKQRFLVAKLKYFLEISQGVIGQEPVWADLFKQSRGEEARLDSDI